MKLNKSSSYTLIELLNGHNTATKIANQLQAVNVRSVQRALATLAGMGLLAKHGTGNAPTYSVNYPNLLSADVPDKLLDDEDRPESRFNYELVGWLKSTPVGAVGDKLVHGLGMVGQYTTGEKKGAPPAMTAKELEYLTVELSWKSSALEGNTYSLLDTQILLLEGVKAKNKTEFETQMILNHKAAIAFIVEHGELFRDEIVFSTVEELHKTIGYNLGIGVGIRKRSVRISASNYLPPANPHLLREYIDDVLAVINRTPDPVLKGLFALALVPYLQAFEDGNKRTGRLLANAILIHAVGQGFSLRKVSARQLAVAYLVFYEFGSMRGLARILAAELVRSPE